MAKKRLAPSKNRYQSMLHTYEGRKKKMREKYPDDIYFKMACSKIDIKIHTFKKAIKRIEKKESFMDDVCKKTIEFNGVNVRLLKGRRSNREQLNTKNCFIKYCMENGRLAGAVVSRWLGRWHCTSSRSRLQLTRSFKTDPDKLKFWHSYLQFMKN